MEDLPLLFLAKIIAVAVILAITYLVGAFVSLDFNPLTWAPGIRALAVIFFVWQFLKLDLRRAEEE